MATIQNPAVKEIVDELERRALKDSVLANMYALKANVPGCGWEEAMPRALLVYSQLREEMIEKLVDAQLRRPIEIHIPARESQRPSEEPKHWSDDPADVPWLPPKT